MSFKSISVIGLGYIGLPTAAMFASKQIKVIGVDVNSKTVDIINSGGIHIIEPELDILVQDAVQRGYLRASINPEPADAFLIAVPTPFKEGQQPDLSYIEQACKAISTVIKAGDLVVLESTSPVGTTEKVAEWLSNERPDLSFPSAANDIADISIAHCPERVLPGQVVRELVENDRVIGGISKECSKRAVELYKIFVQSECIVTNARTAEMAKLTENASRDVSIAFANELSLICDQLDINVWELIELANRHPRVNILQPGPGVGGHCIAVDPWFIVANSPEQAKLIHTARLINDNKPEWVIEQIKAKLAEYLVENPNKTANQVTIACFGLAFKPNIDDLRESPALGIVKKLIEWFDGELLAIEPNIDDLPNSIAQKVQLTSIDVALAKADINVILVKHGEFELLSNYDWANKYFVDTIGLISSQNF